MRWLLFSHQRNVVVKQCGDLLQAIGQTVLYEYHAGSSSSKKIKEKITEKKPDRIVVIINGENPVHPNSLDESLHELLLIPLYVAQATSHVYSPIPILLLTSTTEEQSKDSISTNHFVQNATDELINIYPHILNARLMTPINEDDFQENALLARLQALWSTNPEESHHVTILSDALPILLALIHDGKASGQIEVHNRGTISLRSFEHDHVHPSKAVVTTPSSINGDGSIEKFERLSKQMISPETRQLYQASFVLPDASTSLRDRFRELSLEPDVNQPKTLLVTGGYGFIGSTFINHWLETYPNDRIVNIDRLDAVSNMKNIQKSESPSYSSVFTDINNKDIVLHLMNQYNVTHVVHFAVQAHLDTSFGNSITFTESNVFGTHSMLEAGRIYGKIQKFVHISTDEVYGEAPAGSYQELSLLNPTNPYAATIAAAEFLVKSYGESFKLSYCIVRLSNVYGPRQHVEKVIPRFINNLIEGKKLRIDGDGHQIRYYVYIDDIIRAIDIILNRGKTKMIYNIGSEDGLTVLDIAKAVLQKIQPERKAEDVIMHTTPRSFKEKRYSSTLSGAAKSLGWEARVSLDQGLDRTIQWYRENPNYWSKAS